MQEIKYSFEDVVQAVRFFYQKWDKDVHICNDLGLRRNQSMNVGRWRKGEYEAWKTHIGYIKKKYPKAVLYCEKNLTPDNVQYMNLYRKIANLESKIAKKDKTIARLEAKISKS